MYTSPRRVDFRQGYPVRLRAALNRGEGRLMTLSEGGAYIATPVHLLPQAQLSVTIDIPELERSVEVEAIVAWENRGSRRPSAQPEGYGLRFIRVPSASEEAIRWLLKRDERAHLDPERTRALSPLEVREAMERATRVAQEPKAKTKASAEDWSNPFFDSLNEWEPRAGNLADLDFEMPGDDPDDDFLEAELTSEDEDEGEDEDEDERDEAPADEGPPYRLERASIDARVPPSSPGVFVLSYDGRFDARIGRADSDLRRSLSEFLGDYGFFHYEVVTARRDRFERECELFHRLGGDRLQLDNEEHPLPPPGPQLKCPICVKGVSG